MQPNDPAGQGSKSLWGHPLVPVVISGMCSILVVSASVTVALLVAGRGLVQAANQVIWPFVVIVLASVTLCSLLHLFVLGRLTGEHLFRIDRTTLWKRTSPLIWVLLSAIVPAALCGQGAQSIRRWYSVCW